MRHKAYERLTWASASRVATLVVGQSYNPLWYCDGQLSLSINCTKIEQGLIVERKVSNSCYLINLVYQSTGFGRRPLWVCPNNYCQNNAGILFYSKCHDVFLCRRCIKPSYSSQNDSRIDYLGQKIIELRERLWGRDHVFNVYGDGLMDTCIDWEKPKRKKNHLFIKEKARIVQLEKEFWRLAPVSVRSLSPFNIIDSCK